MAGKSNDRGSILFREALNAYLDCVQPDRRDIILLRPDKRPATAINFNSAEHQVIPHIINGASNKEIAARLGMKMANVKLHVRTLCQKLGASNRTQAALALHKMMGY